MLCNFAIRKRSLNLWRGCYGPARTILVFRGFAAFFFCWEGVKNQLAMSATPVQKELSRIAKDYRRFELFKRVSVLLGIHAGFGVLLFILNNFAGISIPLVIQLLCISAF